MAKRIRKRKCRNCHIFFLPDHRNAWHQEYCSKPEWETRPAKQPAGSDGWGRRKTEIISGAPRTSIAYRNGARPIRATGDENPPKDKNRYKISYPRKSWKIKGLSRL